MSDIKPVLYLGGGGNMDDSAALDAKFFGRLSNGARILYMPVAMLPHKFPKAHGWFSGLVARHKPDLDITMLTHENVSDINLDDYDAVFVGGGNTFRLLDFVKRHGLDKKLRDFMFRGNPVYGGSAGAIIMGADINIAREMDDPTGYEYNIGLDMLAGACVACHWPRISEYVHEFATCQNRKIYCIPEDCGMIFDINGHLLETVGAGTEIL